MARERIRGIDEPLPEGETLLWQGRPDARALSRDVFRVRLFIGYFVALAALSFVLAPGGSALARAAWLLVLGGVLVGGLHLYARATARSSIYAITDRRIVMGVGVAFPSVFNLPFSKIADAGVHHGRDGTGNIALRLQGSDRVGYVFLWPHVRPWKFRDPQPTLRCVPEVDDVAATLREALLAHGVVPQNGAERTRVRYSLRDDDGIEILSNDPTPQRTG